MEKVKKIDTRFRFVSPQNSRWIEEILSKDDFEKLGDNPHPVDILFRLTSHYVPALNDMPIQWNTIRNQLKSKLKKVREYFVAWEIESPIHWCPFIDFDENDKKFVLNLNICIASMRKHFLLEEVNELRIEQHRMINQMRELKKESDVHRSKLQKVIEIVENGPSTPFNGAIIDLVTKEPQCFKPFAKQ